MSDGTHTRCLSAHKKSHISNSPYKNVPQKSCRNLSLCEDVLVSYRFDRHLQDSYRSIWTDYSCRNPVALPAGILQDQNLQDFDILTGYQFLQEQLNSCSLQYLDIPEGSGKFLHESCWTKMRILIFFGVQWNLHDSNVAYCLKINNTNIVSLYLFLQTSEHPARISKPCRGFCQILFDEDS